MAARSSDESQIPQRLYCRDGRGRFASPRRPSGTECGSGGANDCGRSPSVEGTIHHRLNKFRPDVLEQLLGPLKNDQQVSLALTDLRLPKKTRRYKPVLVLVPYRQAGCPQGYLLAAMPPYGAEMIDPSKDLRPGVFARLGLSFTLASAIATALRYVLLGERHE